MAFEYMSWPIMFLSIIFDDMSWLIMFLSIIFDDMSWPMIIDGISLAFMFEVILPWPIMLVYIVWSIMFTSMLRLIMLVDRSRPIRFGIPWFVMSDNLYKEDIWLFLDLMLDEVISMPMSMLFGILCMSFPSSMRELESMYE